MSFSFAWVFAARQYMHTYRACGKACTGLGASQTDEMTLSRCWTQHSRGQAGCHDV